MPKSRFRRSATRSRAPPRFEEAGSNQGRSPHSPRPRVPPKTKVSVFPLGRPEPGAKAPDPHRPAPPRRASPPQRPPSRARHRSELRHPAPPDLPHEAEAPARDPFRDLEIEASSDPSNRRTVRRRQALAIDPFAAPRSKRTSTSKPPDPGTQAEAFARNPFVKAVQAEAVLACHILDLARGAGPSLGSRGEPWPKPESSGRGPCRPLRQPGRFPSAFAAGMWLRLASSFTDQPRLGRLPSRTSESSACAFDPAARKGALASGFREIGPPFEGSASSASALAGGLPIRPLRAFPSVHEGEAVMLARVGKAESACG